MSATNLTTRLLARARAASLGLSLPARASGAGPLPLVSSLGISLPG